MYVPTLFAMQDMRRLRPWLAAHPLGVLITADASGVHTSPLPFLLREANGVYTLVTHLARANPHAAALEHASACVVVFLGEQNYVTPSWYPSKHETHKVVPTWNYAAVEIKGQVQLQTQAQWLHTQVSQVTDAMEHPRAQPWSVTDAPPDYVQAQLQAIVGLEVTVTSIQGKWKMSQNRPTHDAQGVIQGLSDPRDPHANPDVAQAVRNSVRPPRQ